MVSNGVVVPAPLQLMLADTNGNQFTTNYPFGDLISAIGNSVAYVGFTASTGGQSAQQQIDNFTFQYLAPPVLYISLAGNGNITISWSAGTGLNYHLQQSASVTGPWTNVSTTPTLVNGYNQIVASPTGATQFYRLSL